MRVTFILTILLFAVSARAELIVQTQVVWDPTHMLGDHYFGISNDEPFTRGDGNGKLFKNTTNVDQVSGTVNRPSPPIVLTTNTLGTQTPKVNCNWFRAQTFVEWFHQSGNHADNATDFEFDEYFLMMGICN